MFLLGAVLPPISHESIVLFLGSPLRAALLLLFMLVLLFLMFMLFHFIIILSCLGLLRVAFL